MWRLEIILLVFLSIVIASIGVVCLVFITPQTIVQGINPWITIVVIIGGIVALGAWLWVVRMANRESSKQVKK